MTSDGRPVPLLEEAQEAALLDGVRPRAQWAGGTVSGSARPLGRVTRLTVHHEGGPVRQLQSEAETAGLLRGIEGFHVRSRGWLAIGYHLIVDPAGRVWEGRPTHLQGAHVRNHNRGNLGIMVVGNFDRQHPTRRQQEVIIQLLRSLRTVHGVALEQVRTHQEWTPTRCPGRHLQACIDGARRAGRLQG